MEENYSTNITISLSGCSHQGCTRFEKVNQQPGISGCARSESEKGKAVLGFSAAPQIPAFIRVVWGLIVAQTL